MSFVCWLRGHRKWEAHNKPPGIEFALITLGYSTADLTETVSMQVCCRCRQLYVELRQHPTPSQVIAGPPQQTTPTPSRHGAVN